MILEVASDTTHSVLPTLGACSFTDLYCDELGARKRAKRQVFVYINKPEWAPYKDVQQQRLPAGACVASEPGKRAEGKEKRLVGAGNTYKQRKSLQGWKSIFHSATYSLFMQDFKR